MKKSKYDGMGFVGFTPMFATPMGTVSKVASMHGKTAQSAPELLYALWRERTTGEKSMPNEQLAKKYVFLCNGFKNNHNVFLSDSDNF